MCNWVEQHIGGRLCSDCRHQPSAAQFTMPGMKQSLVHLTA